MISQRPPGDLHLNVISWFSHQLNDKRIVYLDGGEATQGGLHTFPNPHGRSLR